MSGYIDTSAPKHDASTYRNRKCRCDECRADWALYGWQLKKVRRAKLDAEPDRVVHGKASTYRNHGCRCDACRSAATEQRRKERKAKQP